MKVGLAVTSFIKNPALRALLQSAVDYLPHYEVVIADDSGDNTALEVYEEFKDKLVLNYIGGPNKGIAGNKNRCIYYILEKSDWQAALLCDDDIEFTSPRVVDEFLKAYELDGEAHINSYLGDQAFAGKGVGIFGTFPVLAETDCLYKANGSAGICSFYTRQILEKVGYYQKFPYRYGYEHSEHSARALRMQGKCPELFPTLKRSDKILKTQEIPNNYEVDLKIVYSKQNDAYRKYLTDTYKGINLYNSQHNLDITKETIK